MSGSNAQAKDQARQKATLKRLITAGKVHLTADQEFMIAGRKLNGAQLLAELQSMLQPHLDLETATQQARVIMANARGNVLKTLPQGRAYLSAASTTLKVWFGGNVATLKQFGVPTGLRRQPTVFTKAQAVGSRLLTRKERHTMGPRQRLAVRGGEATAVLAGPDGQPLSGPKKGRK